MPNPLDNLKRSLQGSIDQYSADQKKASGGGRTIVKKFYVNAEEDQAIQELRQGVKESHYFRSRVLGRSVPRPRPVIPQINREAYIALANIRANINQVTKVLNTVAKQGRSLPDLQECLSELKKLEAILIDVQLQLSQATDEGRMEDDAF